MGKRDKLFIQWLAKRFSEKRSDVTDICVSFLETGVIPSETWVEQRFIQAHIPETDIDVEYDTLTTEISYRKTQSMELWEQCINHEYKD